MTRNAHPLGNNGRKKTSGVVLGVLLIFGTVVGIATFSPNQAFAAVDIQTSNTKFFGNSFVRVLITDTAKTQSTDTALATVDIKRGSSTLASPQVTVLAIGTSGQFEFFIGTVASDPAAPTFVGPGFTPNDPDSVVLRVASPAPATNANDPAAVAQALQDGDSFVITYGGQSRTVNFQSTIGTVGKDRATAGDLNIITVSITDPDPNTDPTKIDAFTASSAVITGLISSTNRIVFDTSSPVFTETGQNTGIFEHTFQVGGTASGTQSVISLTSPTITLPQSLTFRVTDHKVYPGSLSGSFSTTTTTSTPSTSIVLQNSDGTVSVAAPVTFANGIQLSINDADRNIDTQNDDSIPAGNVFITVDATVTNTLDVAYTTTGAVVTTTTTGTASVSVSQVLTFTADPGIITSGDIGFGAITGTGTNLTTGTPTVSSITGSGNTRTITISIPLTVTGAAVTNAAVGTLPVTVTTDNAVGLLSATSGGAPSFTAGTAGATAGAGNAQTVAITDSTAGVAIIPMAETDDNTGVFLPDLTDERVSITIGSTNTILASGTQIQLTAATIADDPDLTITYVDPAGSPSGQEIFILVVSLSHAPGTVSAPGTVGITSSFTLTLTDSDLNTNANTAESYIVTYSSGTTANNAFADGAAELTLEVKGATFAWSGSLPALTITFIETGANTGVFEATDVDMSIINQQISGGLKDGDLVEFEYVDKMESPEATSTAAITIGKPGNAISVDKTSIPVPMPAQSGITTGGIVFAAAGADTVKVVITVTDATANTNPSSTETITIPTSAIARTLSGGASMTNEITVNGGNAVTLTETGLSTGVFRQTVNIVPGSGFTSSATSLPSGLDGARISFTYDGNTASVTMKPSDMAISTDKSRVANGDTVIVRLTDNDRNVDPSTVEKVKFYMLTRNDNVDNPTGKEFEAEETGPNTGIFVKEVRIGKDLKVSDTTSMNFASSIEIKARERVASDGTISPTPKERTITVTGQTGTIQLDTDIVGPGTEVIVLVNDKDLDTNPDGTETVAANTDFVRVTTDRSGVGIETPAADETGPSTGIFEIVLKMTPYPATGTATITVSGNEVTVPVLPGDVVAVRYTDQRDAQGNSITVSRTFTVISVDPEMRSDVNVVSVGGIIQLTIADADANVGGDVVDSISLRIKSTSDPVGFTTSAIETGPNTGTFTTSISTSATVTAGSINARTGDNVSIEYEDKYPADYADRVDTVLNPAKKFILNVPVGTSDGGSTTVTPGAPGVRDAQGRPVSQVLAGQQVVLASTIVHNEDSTRSYAALVEVRDSNDVTVYLQWQEGTLQPNAETGIGVSWTPDSPGRYTVRVFVLSSLTNPQILSPVVTSTVNVS